MENFYINDQKLLHSLQSTITNSTCSNSSDNEEEIVVYFTKQEFLEQQQLNQKTKQLRNKIIKNKK